MAGERISGAQQENLLTVLAHDDVSGKIVSRMANPDLFEGDYREVAVRLIAYWKKHKKAPKVHAADLFGDILDDEKNLKRRTFERILRNIDHLSEGMNTEYVMATLRSFTRLQTMKDSILKAAETLQNADDTSIQQVEEMLGDLLRAREFNFDPGITLANVNLIVDYLENRSSEFRLGIPPLDRGDIIPARGATFLWLAATGVGKSWALVHTGKSALLQRKKVLHISLEMSAEEVGQRYFQSLFSIAKRKVPVEIQRFDLTDDNYEELRRMGKPVTVTPVLAFDDPKIRSKLERELKPWMKQIPNLMIKRFPNRGLTIDGLRAFLDGLEAATGFIPDMLILDYIGIMFTDPKNPRISLGRVMEEFRGICVERNIAGVTAHQVSKAGANADIVRSTHVSEDWSIIQTTDISVTITKSDAEKRLGLARLFVDKSRSEKGGQVIVVTQAFDIGQFALQAAPLDKVYRDYVKANQREEDGEDDDDSRD